MSEWRSARLSELADIRVSNVDKKTSSAESAVRLCNYMDVYSNDYIRADLPFMEASASSVEIAKFKVQRGDVLITKDSETPDDIGIPAVAVEEVDDLVCGYHLALIKPKRDLVDPVFLMKQLSTAATASYFARHAAGSTRYGLSNGAIANTRIQLAPLQQQRRIAAILTSLDTAIEKTEALIEKHQQIKAGLMHDLFTRGVLPNGQLRPTPVLAPDLYKQTVLGVFPLSWTIPTLDTACASIVDCPHSTPMFQQDGVLVARTMHIKSGVFMEDSASRVSETQYWERVARLEPRPGDVIFSREAPVGEAFAIPKGMRICLGQRVMLLRPNRAVLDSTYLVAQVYSGPLRARIAELVAGTTNPHLNVEDVRNLVIPLPPLDEQGRLSIRIDAINSRLAMEHERVRKFAQEKLGLMQDLLTGKVPVKVEAPVQEPVDA